MTFCIICVFALLINKVSLQGVNVVEGVTGGSVVLPCATNETKHKLSDIIVHWRHNDSLPVCAIIKGTFSLQDQVFTYKNRVESFPTEYKKGNFSLKLNNLKHADAGEYLCFILHSSEQLTLITQLTIKESTVQIGEKPTEENGNQARETESPFFFAFLGVLILSCLALCVLFICKKRCEGGDYPHVVYDLRVKGNIEPHSNSTSVPENTFSIL
ncbi:T-cell surface glycoprotein CD4-like [Paramisgurnus dabryanus]|uniref:T-cell surface glycoprotein CD4-like n=1 Tax=Paramisgurnus dabryanus TaxID=90735 RepID=UPI0031F43AD1